MSGVAIIREMLLAHPPVIALVSAANIVAGGAPSARPGIGIKEIGRTEAATVAPDQANGLVNARIQVTVYGTTYVQQKALLLAVKLGPGSHTGVYAGMPVRGVAREVVGPDVVDPASGAFLQSRDFIVTYVEPN